MVDIRKIISTREMVLSGLGVAAPRPVVRAVGMAVILNPFAGRVVDHLRPLFEARAMLGERLDAASDAKQRRWLDRMRDCGRRLI